MSAKRSNDEARTFLISVAAELAGMHAQTLRTYDRLGLVRPQRSSGGGRRYSQHDVDLLREVQRLSQDGIVNALAEVPHDFRDVVVLVDIGEFSYAEAAQILDIPIGTVMSRLHRGRRILKHKLAEETVP